MTIMIGRLALSCALLTLCFAQQAAAQQEEDGGDIGGACGNMDTCFGGHKMCGPGWEYNNAHCAGCYVCVVEWSECHPDCIPPFADARTREAYRAMVAAAVAGDVEKVLMLAPRAREFVSINRARHAVQIKSCNGDQLIASLNVPISHWAFAAQLQVPIDAQTFGRPLTIQ